MKSLFSNPKYDSQSNNTIFGSLLNTRRKGETDYYWLNYQKNDDEFSE